jgi:hypothetical protein
MTHDFTGTKTVTTGAFVSVPSTESLLEQILGEMRQQSITLTNIYSEVDRLVRRQEQKK